MSPTPMTQFQQGLLHLGVTVSLLAMFTTLLVLGIIRPDNLLFDFIMSGICFYWGFIGTYHLGAAKAPPPAAASDNSTVPLGSK